MKGKKLYDIILPVVYFAMLGLCIYLSGAVSYENVIINGAMFIIVGIIFLTTILQSFQPMRSVVTDLGIASTQIKNDAINTNSYLWDMYQQNNVKLFRTNTLQNLMNDFVFDLNTASSTKNIYYKPSIDNYINIELVDKVMHRNELNQISGVLTGLGMLGTFIGLSLGLQGFNLNSDNMTNSIIILMDGIKVAFHTSIYGMVFSLTFNFIYKKKLFEAENAIENFIGIFKKYVMPDTNNDGMNMLIEMTGQQIVLLHKIQLALEGSDGKASQQRQQQQPKQSMNAQRNNVNQMNMQQQQMQQQQMQQNVFF